MTNFVSAEQLNLADLSCKYLNSLIFIKSCSPHTIRAYTTDLSQVFNLKNWGTFVFVNNKVEFQLKKRGTPPSIASSKLLNTAYKAQSNWTHLSLATRNRKSACLKSFFNWLYNEKIITENLAYQITCPKVPKKLPHFLSLDEVLSLIKYLEKRICEQPT